MIHFEPMTDEEQFNWISNRAGCYWSENVRGIVAYEIEKILAGVVFEGWTHTGCIAHIAVEDPRVYAAGFVSEIKRYIFDECGKSHILGTTPSNNEASLALQKLIGMKELFRIKDGFDHGVDYVISRMDDDGRR